MNELMVMAQIAGRRCAFKAMDVQSVIEVGTISPVPKSPPFIAGITAMRSQALTVIDTRRAIGFDNGQWPTDERAAVVAIGGHSYALSSGPAISSARSISTAGPLDVSIMPIPTRDHCVPNPPGT